MSGMKSNLLSLGQLLEKGFVMKIEDNVLKVYASKKRLVLKAHLSKNRTFKVRIDVMEHECLATVVRKSEWLWHYRFGCLNFRDLNLLHRDNMMLKLPHIQVSSEVCEKCLEWNHTRNIFKQNVSTRSRDFLEGSVLERKLSVLVFSFYVGRDIASRERRFERKRHRKWVFLCRQSLILPTIHLVWRFPVRFIWSRITLFSSNLFLFTFSWPLIGNPSSPFVFISFFLFSFLSISSFPFFSLLLLYSFLWEIGF